MDETDTSSAAGTVLAERIEVCIGHNPERITPGSAAQGRLAQLETAIAAIVSQALHDLLHRPVDISNVVVNHNTTWKTRDAGDYKVEVIVPQLPEYWESDLPRLQAQFSRRAITFFADLGNDPILIGVTRVFVRGTPDIDW
jgi:hypothetical protein